MASPFHVSAWLPPWDQRRARQSALEHVDVVDEVMPFWYEVAEGPRIAPYPNAEDADLLRALRDAGITVVPTIANGKDPEAVDAVLSTPASRSAHVRAVVDLVDSRRYDGIDIDYEDLRAEDRGAFSALLYELAAALHDRGKTLGVAVYAKTSEPGTWAGPQAQDYAALGQLADRVQVMGYDLHWQTSPPGPIGPVWWLDDVLAFATSVVPAIKLSLGVHLYGYDWVGQHAESQTWDVLMQRRREHAADVAWSPADSECHFTYTAGEVPHTVWYGEARSVDARLDLTERHALGGVALWCLGGEDPQVWEAVRRHSTDRPAR